MYRGECSLWTAWNEFSLTLEIIKRPNLWWNPLNKRHLFIFYLFIRADIFWLNIAFSLEVLQQRENEAALWNPILKLRLQSPLTTFITCLFTSWWHQFSPFDTLAFELIDQESLWKRRFRMKHSMNSANETARITSVCECHLPHKPNVSFDGNLDDSKL